MVPVNSPSCGFLRRAVRKQPSISQFICHFYCLTSWHPPSVNTSATFTASHHGTLHQLIHLPLLLPHTMAPSISQYVCHVYCLTWHRPSVNMSTTFTASHHGTIHQSSSTFAASHHGTIHQSIHLPLSLPHIMAVFCIKKKVNAFLQRVSVTPTDCAIPILNKMMSIIGVQPKPALQPPQSMISP